MTKKKSTSPRTDAQSLRHRAEELVSSRSPDLSNIPIEDVQALIQELSVHQVELELQNEELREAQVELADSRDRYVELYDFAPVGYVTLDQSGKICEANLTAAQMLRMNREDVMGRPLSKFMTTEGGDLLYLHLMRVFETHCTQACGLQLGQQDEAPCTIRLESVEIPGKEPRQCRTIMSDITELTQVQETAERSQRLAALGTMAAGIAHEINNPLWMISLQADVALAAVGSPERERKVRQCLNEIKQLVERGGRVVKSVLNFAQKENATQKWSHSLTEVLARARDYTRQRAESKQIEVELEVDAHPPNVTMNPTQMEQVFVNLLTNAILASSTGGRVRVVASWNTKSVQVRVEDQGCGISSDDYDRIFDPFYTVWRHESGTGLGLSVAFRIIKDHEGTIQVTSELGEGTTMTVSLPITSPQIAEG